MLKWSKKLCQKRKWCKNEVKKDVVKKAVYDEMVKKVNAIQTFDTRDLVEKLTTTKKL